MNAMAEIARAECEATQAAWSEPEWHDRDLPPDYGQHKRPRGWTRAMVRAAWDAGYRGTTEIAEIVGVTPSMVSQHKKRLGLPSMHHGRHRKRDAAGLFTGRTQ